MTPLEHLQLSRSIISNPKLWATCHGALDSRLRPVHPRDSQAMKWCAYGILAHFSEDSSEIQKAESFLQDACIELYGHNEVANINDHVGHSAVMSIYDRAIELAKGGI